MRGRRGASRVLKCSSREFRTGSRRNVRSYTERRSRRRRVGGVRSETERVPRHMKGCVVGTGPWRRGCYESEILHHIGASKDTSEGGELKNLRLKETTTS